MVAFLYTGDADIKTLHHSENKTHTMQRRFFDVTVNTAFSVQVPDQP